MEITDQDEFIVNWNIQHPFDRRWRLKYNVPFGSEQHLSTSFINMVYDLREDDIYTELKEEEENKQSDLRTDKLETILDVLKRINKAFDGSNLQNKVLNPTKEEVLEDYENLDISKF